MKKLCIVLISIFLLTYLSICLSGCEDKDLSEIQKADYEAERR